MSFFLRKNIKPQLKANVIERDGQCCNACKEALEPKQLTIDHIVPLFRGGESDLSNVQLLCTACYREKNQRELLNSPLWPL